MKINKFNDVEFPTKSGWFWVLVDGYENPTPCWFSYSEDDEDCYFLPGGMGDSSSMGLYRAGPEIIEPKL